jgi:hypothetical protein
MNTFKAIGKICKAVTFDKMLLTAHFTLEESGNLHHIGTVGLEQYEMMAELQHYQGHLFVCGLLTTFNHPICRKHHSKIEPLWIARVEDYTPVELLQLAAQWESAVMYKRLKQLSTSNELPRRERLETQEVQTLTHS